MLLNTICLEIVGSLLLPIRSRVGVAIKGWFHWHNMIAHAALDPFLGPNSTGQTQTMSAHQ